MQLSNVMQMQCNKLKKAQQTLFICLFTNFPRLELSIKQKKKRSLIRENAAFSLAHLFDV